MNKNRHTPSRIPIRFVDDEASGGQNKGETERDERNEGGEQTAEELGRASIYEDATEMQRRINRGGEDDTSEGQDRADDADTAGALPRQEMPERRGDQDTNPSHAENESRRRDASATGHTSGGDADGEDDSDDSSPRMGEASGPVLAELIATRAELKRVEGELQKFTEERQDLVDKVARRQADFENYRKRMERERQETYSRVVAEVVGHLLPVVDNLRRAVDAEASVEGGESEEFRHFLRGVELIARQLDGVLETLGVETVQTVGQPFDPHIHEAVAAEESDRFKPDTVMEELVRGYRLGDKLLRPAMVKVAK
ncbi:MAG TPA: nucleotide exchange factor GrpE [Pyrinomonadaceae bacterium]|nr:nucleotide exchange factor GrpE [Pyrinomonadaceae bacterium]